MNPQAAPDHYFNMEYDTKERFCSYWHQIQAIVLRQPGQVLEIGIGNGFVSRYLRTRDIDITTLDIDGRLKPDIAASVLNIPFRDNAFPIVACCELLEHMPYGDAAMALSEIRRVAGKYVIMSLPDAGSYFRVYIQIPKTADIKKLVPLPWIRRGLRTSVGQHCWEIGTAGYPLKRITADLEKQGLQLERTYRVYEMPYHRFFILRKNR